MASKVTGSTHQKTSLRLLFVTFDLTISQATPLPSEVGLCSFGYKLPARTTKSTGKKNQRQVRFYGIKLMYDGNCIERIVNDRTALVG